ncbi:MAG: hypothetical protein B6244_01635 [Candidatus Cloacimonetes bacterium 4572_55]|nr:MAG: hypothetical protein B6244_01635 [Candidatus Cloacimonetes bacterium 4572_55]
MDEYADLHLHTEHSDGDASVEELLQEARKTDLIAIAITDHDCMDGIPEALKLSGKYNLQVIPGIEMSSYYGKIDVHVLGYFIDHEHPEIVDYCHEFREIRNRRGMKMVEKLNNMGVSITFDHVLEIANNGVIGRPHVAQAILQNGFVQNFQAAFSKYIGSDAPAYVLKKKIAPETSIDLIHRAGGVAVLAHPVTMGNDGIISYLASRGGLDGLEVYHTRHRQLGCEAYYRGLADKYGLIPTGGSDWHGSRTPYLRIGSSRVRMEHVRKLAEIASGRRSQVSAPL